MPMRVISSALACGLLLAACGRSSTTGSAKKGEPYGPRNSPYALSKCMRDNGLSHFPDPSRGPNGGGIGFPEGLFVTNAGLTVDGISFSGPALKKASQVCKTYLPPGGPPPTISAAQKRVMLRVAECMRANGAPNFPDPGAAPGGRGEAKQVPLPGSNSPAFNHAVKVCGGGHGIAVSAAP
jgi:hypothetical protein